MLPTWTQSHTRHPGVDDDPLARYRRDPTLVRVIDIGSGPTVPPPADATALALFDDMLRLRVFDERVVTFQRQGRVGTYPTAWGEEAVQAGAVRALDARDWLFPSYRQSAAGLLRGIPALDVLRQSRGHMDGLWDPAEHRVAPISHPVATHLPHAAGAAWAEQVAGTGAATLAFVGDGGTSEGDFHEGLNHAAVLRAPMVVLCHNNQWAISTPLRAQSANPALAERGAGYGIPAIRVDGFDVLAVHLAVVDALERARAGEGPSLVEAVSWRIAPHATADDPARYRDEVASGRWRAIEPVDRLRGWLAARGLLDEDRERAVREAARREAGDAMAIAENQPPPPLERLVDTHFARTPPGMRRQVEALRADRADRLDTTAGSR